MSQGFENKSVDVKKSSRPVRKPRAVAEIGDIQQSLIKYFKDIKDPRVERSRKTSTHRHLGNCDFSHNWRSALVGKISRITALVNKRG